MRSLDPELYKQAFRHTTNPTLFTDTNYVIQDVNEALVDFTGYEREELIGELPTMFFNDPAEFNDLIETIERGDSWTRYMELETKQGQLIYGRAEVTALGDTEGAVSGYGGFFVDLTERRRYEQALKVIHRVLRHDLRNEMNIISGLAEALQQEFETTEADHFERKDFDAVGMTQRILDRSNQLIRRAEKARKLQNVLYEGYEKPIRPVPLDRVLRDEVNAARQRYPEAEFVTGEIPEVEVVANDLLEEVFDNMLENAVEHNDHDPRVEIDVQDGKKSVTVTIADDGPGIPAEKRDEIFGREEEDQLHHGEGLSLFFDDAVVGTYGGTVSVEESDLGGASFDIELRKL